MKRNIIAMAVFFAFVLAAGVRAQGQENAKMSGKQRGACKADVQNLCKDQKGGQILTCMMSNIGQIQNAACKEHITKFKAKDDAVKQACSVDITQYKCTGMDIGTGLLKCLFQNRKSLSDGCKAELRKGRMGRMARRRQQGGNTGGQAAQSNQGDQQQSDDSSDSDQ